MTGKHDGRESGEVKAPPPVVEGYPSHWQHAMIHLNPETGEMHSDGDHRVRQWIQDHIKPRPVPPDGPTTID